VKVESVSIRNANLMVVVSWVGGDWGIGNDWAVNNKGSAQHARAPTIFLVVGLMILC
jgi:hypothetical protein